MIAHVRKGFEKWRSTFEDYADDVRFESAFRAGVRFEQGRRKPKAEALARHIRHLDICIIDLKDQFATALELLSRTPAGKREADKLREVLK